MTTRATTHDILVPVRAHPGGKSRLAVPGDRDRLVEAFARDTIAAAVSCTCADVYVVGGPPWARELGVEVLPDEGMGDLNAALVAAAARLGRVRRTAVLLADLPCLHPDDLDAALARSLEVGRCFTADAAGTGTTLLVAGAGEDLAPRFGADSAAAHRGGGATRICDDLVRLRRDVDTIEDLAAADRLGVGPHSAAVLAS